MSQTGTRHRTDWLSLLLVTLFAGVTTFLLVKPDALPPGAAPFAEQYGPARNSQWAEEWLIRDFFQDRRAGVFLDVGAHDPKVYSNTYYLETVLGWSGIAVEPQAQFAQAYATLRPRTRFRPFFVSDRSDEEGRLYVLEYNTLVSSTEKTFTERYGKGAKLVTAPTVTLNELLAAEGVERIDFMSMDIELSEPKALAGLDIERFRPELVCIEAHPEVVQQILDYFAHHRYVVVGKYLRADTNNLYFTPMARREN